MVKRQIGLAAGPSFLLKRDAKRFAASRKKAFRETLRGADTPARRAFLKKAIRSVKIRTIKGTKGRRDFFQVIGM